MSFTTPRPPSQQEGDQLGQHISADRVRPNRLTRHVVTVWDD